MMFTQILRRKQMLRRISGSRVPSRLLGADTTFAPAAAAASVAAAVPGLESIKEGLGSRGDVRIYRAQVISG